MGCGTSQKASNNIIHSNAKEKAREAALCRFESKKKTSSEGTQNLKKNDPLEVGEGKLNKNKRESVFNQHVVLHDQ